MVKFSRLDEFKDRYSFEQRTKEAAKLMNKYPDRVGVIVTTQDNMTPLDKRKFLVPRDNTVGQFMHVIRKRLIVPHKNAIWLSPVNESIPPIARTMGEMHKEYMDKDGMLYLKVNEETTFGSNLFLLG